MGDSVKIDIGGVKGQAARISGVGDEIEGIGGTASGTGLGWDVFGAVGRPFAAIFQHLMQEVGENIKKLGQEAGEVGQSLDIAADDYDRQEGENAQGLEGVY